MKKGETKIVIEKRNRQLDKRAWALWYINDLASARLALENAEAHGAQRKALIVAMAFIGAAERRIRDEVRATERTMT